VARVAAVDHTDTGLGVDTGLDMTSQVVVEVQVLILMYCTCLRWSLFCQFCRTYSPSATSRSSHGPWPPRRRSFNARILCTPVLL
jgi:hypothetical protein